MSALAVVCAFLAVVQAGRALTFAHDVDLGSPRAEPRLRARAVTEPKVVVGAVAVLFAFVALAVVQPAASLLVAACDVVRPVLLERRRRRAHDDAVLDELADVVDLLRVAVASGLNVRLAIDAVAAGLGQPSPFRAAFDRVEAEARRGARLSLALEQLSAVGDVARPLTSALIASTRDGTPLLPALARVGDEARLVRRRAAEERARRLPVKLLFPLVLCILPAFGLLTVVPLLAATLRSLHA